MSVRKSRTSTPSEPITGAGTGTGHQLTTAIKINSVQNGLKKLAAVLSSAKLIQKFNEIQEIINGSFRITREKIQILEDSPGFDTILPVYPAPADQEAINSEKFSHYKSALIDSAKLTFDEEVEKVKKFLNTIDVVLCELDEAIEITGQRFLEEIQQSKTDLNQNFVVYQSCFEDCKNSIIFFKLKSKILKHFLYTASDIAPEKFDPFSHWEEYEAEAENVLLYISKNGSKENGKLLMVNDTLEELLNTTRNSFENQALKVLFSSNGGEIADVELIRDDDILFASEGEPFIGHPPANPKQTCNAVENSTEWVKLNVGGHLFYTSLVTLLNREPASMLAKMFDPDSNIKPSCVDKTGAFLIDRDPKYFAPILNYLRSGNLILDPGLNPKGVLEEANFFGVQSCIPILEAMSVPKDEIPLTRRDVIKAIITTANKSNLRFQGVNLNGADLSYLDLRNINFKYAKLRNAKLSYSNLSYCNFERADLYAVEMNYAILSGVRMACANMENSSCANCNFQDQTGYHAMLEGVNLRNAILEDSDLTGANLRVANLKHANLKATILRGAILAGADLEMCDLTGSDLHEANLRGANLKDAALELMINPLHMAQTIR